MGVRVVDDFGIIKNKHFDEHLEVDMKRIAGKAGAANGNAADEGDYDHGPVTGTTARRFRSAIEVRPVKDLSGLPQKGREVADPQAVVEFDRRYKSYICNYLIEKHKFRRVESKGGNVSHVKYALDIESVYLSVLEKLMLGALDRFDFSRPNVGRGGFRSYLKRIADSVFSDAIKPDLVPVLDEKGNPIYSGELQKDKHGMPKLDAQGRLVLKPKKEFRASLDPDGIAKISRRKFDAIHLENVIVRNYTGVFPKEWSASEISKLRLFFYKIAYIRMIDEMSRSGRASWILPAMVDIYENGLDEESVRDDLINRGVISGEGTFFVAKTRFLDEWKKREAKLEVRCLRKSAVGKSAVAADTGVSTVRKGEFKWSPKQKPEKIEAYCREVMAETRQSVGEARYKFISKRFAEIMMKIALAEDAKVAERNAWRYR